MGKRNPKMHPAPGDMLRWRDRERHVISVHERRYATGLGGAQVWYSDVRKRGSVGELACSLEAWQKWAARIETEVVQTAQEGE